MIWIRRLFLFFEAFYSYNAFYCNIKHIFTVHNFKHQGIVSPEISSDVIGLPDWAEDIIRYDDVRILIKGAMAVAHSIVISDCDYYGWRESPFVNLYRDKITIIPNGCESDGDLVEKSKAEYKQELQNLFGFVTNEKIPLIAATINDNTMEQDCTLIHGALKEFYSKQQSDSQKVSCVTTGSAAHRGYVWDKTYEFTEYLECAFPEKEMVHCGDISYFPKIVAGADICIIPSYRRVRKITAYALRHGTIPVVLNTGGPFDIVSDVENENGCGFVIDEPTPSALADAIMRTIKAYQDTENWDKIVCRAKQCDFSWDNVTVPEYMKLYDRLREND